MPCSTESKTALNSSVTSMLDNSGTGDEAERTKLIDEISRVIRDPSMPSCARTAGLTLIGWLARRKPSERPHALGIDAARESEARVRARREG